MRRIILIGPSLMVVILLLILPLVNLTKISFRENVAGRITFEPGYTISTYLNVLTDSFYIAVLRDTVLLSIASTAVCLAIGFPLAYFLWRAPASVKNLFTLLVIAPLLISIVVRAYGWMVILGDQGVLNQMLIGLGLVDQPVRIMYTTTAMFIGLVHVQFPFMVLSILSSLERVDPTLMSVAETLGASRLRAVVEIVAALAIPGIISGTMLVFTLCMTAFVTPLLLGGSSGRMMTMMIYNQFNTAFDWPRGSALAIVLSLSSLLLVSAFLLCVRRIPLVRRAEAVGRKS